MRTVVDSRVADISELEIRMRVNNDDIIFIYITKEQKMKGKSLKKKSWSKFDNNVHQFGIPTKYKNLKYS